MFSLPKSIKIEDIINLDDYKTAEDLALEWDLSIKKLFKSCCVAEDDSKLEYLMKEYITSLTKASTLEDISTLTKTMLCHINFLYSYYSEFKSCFNESYYLENMEEILTIYTNKEVACLKSIKKKNKREYRRHTRLTTRRIIYALTTYLLNREDHIFHVLIKLNSSSCKDTSNSLFRHFFISKKQIEDMSDEGFCRSYIIFQKWKDLCKPDQRTNMDTLLYEMYKRTPECLKTSEMLRKVLAPKNHTTLDVITQLYSPVSDLSYSYFQYMASKKQCENEAVQSILDSTDDEANISSSDDTDSESSRDFKELINAMSKLNQNLSPTTNSNSGRIKAEEMEDDDDVQIVSVDIPNLRNSEVVCVLDDDSDNDNSDASDDVKFVFSLEPKKINTAPRRRERRKSSTTNSSTLSFLDSIQVLVPPTLMEQTPMDTSTTSSASHADSSRRIEQSPTNSSPNERVASHIIESTVSDDIAGKSSTTSFLQKINRAPRRKKERRKSSTTNSSTFLILDWIQAIHSRIEQPPTNSSPNERVTSPIIKSTVSDNIAGKPFTIEPSAVTAEPLTSNSTACPKHEKSIAKTNLIISAPANNVNNLDVTSRESTVKATIEFSIDVDESAAISVPPTSSMTTTRKEETSSASKSVIEPTTEVTPQILEPTVAEEIFIAGPGSVALPSKDTSILNKIRNDEITVENYLTVPSPTVETVTKTYNEAESLRTSESTVTDSAKIVKSPETCGLENTPLIQIDNKKSDSESDFIAMDTSSTSKDFNVLKRGVEIQTEPDINKVVGFSESNSEIVPNNVSELTILNESVSNPKDQSNIKICSVIGFSQNNNSEADPSIINEKTNVCEQIAPSKSSNNLLIDKPKDFNLQLPDNSKDLLMSDLIIPTKDKNVEEVYSDEVIPISDEIVCKQENITNNNRENIKESSSSKFGPEDSQLCKITEVRSLDSEVDLDEDMLLNSPPENDENENETASNCTNFSDKITPEEEAHHLSFINSAQSKDSVFNKITQKSNNVIIDENCVIDNDFGDTVLYDSADGSTYDSNDLNAELYNTNSLENMKTVNSNISSEDIPSSFNKIDTGQNVDKLQNFEVVNTRTINNVKNKPEEPHHVNGSRVLKLPLQNCLKQVRVDVVDCNQEKNNGKAPETGGIVFNSKETRKTKNASLEEFSKFELINQNKLQGCEDFKEYNSSLSGPISHYNGATATQFDLYDPDENIDIFLSQSSDLVLRPPQNNKIPQRGRTIDQSDIASPSYEGIADFKIDVKTFFAKPLDVIGENAKNALNINKSILKKPCLKTNGVINGETDNKAKTHTIDKYDKIKYFDCSKNNAIGRRHEEQHSLVNVSRKSFQYYGIKLNDRKLRQKMSVVLKRLSASQIMRGDPKFNELFQKRKNYKFIRVDYVEANERETGYENNLDACFHQSSTSYRKPQNNSVRTVSGIVDYINNFDSSSCDEPLISSINTDDEACINLTNEFDKLSFNSNDSLNNCVVPLTTPTVPKVNVVCNSIKESAAISQVHVSEPVAIIDPESEFSNSPKFLQDTDELLVQNCLQDGSENNSNDQYRSITEPLSFLSNNSNFYESQVPLSNDKTDKSNVNESIESNSQINVTNNIVLDDNFKTTKKESVDDLQLPAIVPDSYDFDKNLKNNIFSKLDLLNFDNDSDCETRLPLKKRKLSVSNSKKEEEISYPATPMISIAEVEALRKYPTSPNSAPQRQFKTPAERKELPPLPSDFTTNYNKLDSVVNNCTNPSPIVNDQFNINNHTYNNPTINYQANNVPVPFINLPCGSFYTLPSILLPLNIVHSFNNTVPTQERSVIVKKEERKRRGRRNKEDRI